MRPITIAFGWAFVMFGGSSPGYATGTLMDSRNASCDVATNAIYYQIPYWAIPYVPHREYRLERVEFMHGGTGTNGSHTVYFEIHRNAPFWPPLEPTPEVLATGSHELNPVIGWQGGDITPPVNLEYGKIYWIVLRPVLGSLRSTGSRYFCMDEMLWNRSDDGVHWTISGPSERLAWMVRFFGTDTSPIEPVTWTAVRHLYDAPRAPISR